MAVCAVRLNMGIALVPPRRNVHLNSPAPVCVYQGFDVGHDGSPPPRLRPDLEGLLCGGMLNGFPCLRFLHGGKNTHPLQQALLLPVCVKAFPPVTGTVRRAEGCVKYQSGRAGGWAAARRDRGSRPAVDLISPMGLPAGESLPNMIHMCYILSGPLPGCLAERTGREGGER